MEQLIIEPGRGERHYLKELWRYRELLVLLSWRDILVRYKQTVFGILWAFLRPLVTMIAFTFVFGRLAKMPSPEGVSYPVMVLVGTIAWQLFSTFMVLSSQSLINNADMIGKIYFPRAVIPLSAGASPIIDFGINLIFLGLVMVFFQQACSFRILFLPVFVLQALLTALGAGLWLGALTVRYRDFREVTPFLVQFGLFISPVGYVSDVVPDTVRLLYSLNPAVGIIDGFRWCILGESVPFFFHGFLISMGVTLIVLVSGISYFRITEKTLADVI